MPEPTDKLHPGVHVALARGKMDESQVARAIARGELASPQQYGNSWLFALRITGTGRAYREAHDEYVWRDPSIYMNQGFLDRCNGLPVILEHPNKEMLDTKEYRNRNIGAIVYPYLKEDAEEVWGIARVLDQPVARYMAKNQLSTSPAVVFLPQDGNEKVELGGGKHLLIEGKPSLLDHLAVCEEGVWDTGGPAAGVDLGTSRSDSMADMNDEKEKKNEEREDRARRDADESEEKKERKEGGEDREDRARRDAEDDKIDRLLEGIKVLNDRMDSMEAKRKDEDEGEEDKKEAKGDRARRDEDAEHEAKQAAELHKLAEAEEEESREAAMAGDKKDKKRDDARKRDDESEDEEMPWEKAKRSSGESDSAYSRRADALAKEHDSRYQKRDDESTAAHCDRLDAAYRKHNARMDAVRRLGSVDVLADAVAKLANRFDSLASRIEDRSDEDETLFADARARADSVNEAFGDHAARPMRGENLIGYRIRLARGLQKHSPIWKSTDLGAVARSDAAAFAGIEEQVYADAMTAARTPIAVPPGTLREIRKKQQYGGEIIEFAGEPLSWMSSFMMPAQGARITTRPGQHAARP